MGILHRPPIALPNAALGCAPGMQNVQIMIVDPDPKAAARLSEGLTRDGCMCQLATPMSAMEMLERTSCDVVVGDVRKAGAVDFEFLERFRSLSVPVIVVTTGALDEIVDATKHGAFHCITKPYDVAKIRAHVASATTDIERPSMRAPKLADPELIQQSSAMKQLGDAIGRAAMSSAPVLICGESGTGKERVARAVHARGPRSAQPFVPVNTSAIPDQLLESEVFGHVRGAFTGALQARRGLLAEAEGGTLLLDEIGDMPLALQPKLLRVVQFGEVRPVGSDRVRHVDVRVIAATHGDLNELVAKGRFRDDLRYRLSVIPLIVPPLRDRREDIIPLVAQFLREALLRTPESPIKGFSDEAIQVLVKGFWLGNVRELENAVERLVVFGRSRIPGYEHDRRDMAAHEARALDAPRDESTLPLVGARAMRRRQGARVEHPRHQPLDALPLAA